MAEEEKQKLPFFIHDKYIKDLSFENPNFLLKYSNIKQQSEVAVNVQTHVGKVDDTTYEITIQVVAKSTVPSDKSKESSTVFIVDLTYGTLFAVNDSLKNDILLSILLVHVPFLMFPFVRKYSDNNKKWWISSFAN